MSQICSRGGIVKWNSPDREINFLLGTPLLKIIVSPVPDGVGRPYGNVTPGVGKFAILANGTVSGRIGIEPEICEQKNTLFSQFFSHTGL